MANNKLEKKLANIEKKRAKKQQNQEKKEAKKIEQQEKKRERMRLKVESKQEKKRLEAEIKKERIHQKSQQKQENKTRKLEKKEYKKIAKAEKKEQKKKIAQENKRLKAEIKAEKKKIKEEEKAIKKQEKEAKKPPKKEKPKKKPKPKKPKQKKPKKKKKPKEKKTKEKKSKEKNPNDKNAKFDIKTKIASINPIKNRKKDNTPSGEEEIVEGKKPKNKLIIIVAFALALTGIVFFVFNKISSKGEDKPKTQIEESKKEEKKEERKPIDDSNFKKVKEFTVYDKDGKKVSISDYKGKPVIINFWASWCVPCKNEIPYFKNIQKEYGEEVEVLMVNITDNVKETKERALEYVEKSDLKDMNVLFDLDEDASKKYKLVGLPSTLFLTENGKVMNEHLGLMDEEELKKNVNKLLGIEEEKPKEGEDKTEDTKKE